MGNPGTDALSFLLNTIFDLYVMVIALRFLMQTVRADYYNPISQFVVKASNPLLVPLRRLIPGFMGQDMAALVLCWLLLICKLFLFKFMGLGALSIAGAGINIAHVSDLSILSLAAVDLLALFINIIFFAIIIMAVISWINPGNYNPVNTLLSNLTEPFVAPVRRFVPAVGGLDLSPLVVLVLIQLLKILLLRPLLTLAI